MSSDSIYEYDVALSFAGENRPYVEAVAEGLRNHGIKVFYDAYEETKLWGKDLFEHLDRIYRDHAQYCVMFVSEAYAKKAWTTHERRSAFARALQERGEYILPARFDDTEIDGLRSTVGYIDLRTKNPEDFAALLIEKIRTSSEVVGTNNTSSTFNTDSVSKRRLVEFVSKHIELGWNINDVVGSFTGHKMKIQEESNYQGYSAELLAVIQQQEAKYSVKLEVDNVTMWDIDGRVTAGFGHNETLISYTWRPHPLRQVTKNELNAIVEQLGDLYGDPEYLRQGDDLRWTWTITNIKYEVNATWDDLNKGFDIDFTEEEILDR